MNQNGEKYDWENDELANLVMDWTDDKVVHPGFIVEIPGIGTEAEYKDIVGLQSTAQDHTPKVAQRVAGAC